MNAKFGSSGIRGPYGTDITPELALATGRALGSLRRRVVLGRDARTTGPLLRHAAIAGLLAAGAEVTDAGVAPTPAIAFAASTHDAGLVITASHNPAPDNGFKLWEPDGRAFGRDERASIERLVQAPRPGVAWDGVGRVQRDDDIIARHIERIVALRGKLSRRLRVVLDCGNGAASVESPALLRELGCDVITLNAQPDGHFPGRPSEPSDANLADLKRAVVSFHADVGIAHDGDADRCMAVTHAGRYVSGDELLVLFAKRYSGSTIAVPVDATKLVEDATGCRVLRTRVGDAFVSETLAQNKGAWGGEASGAWIFPEMSYCPDGPLAAATLCHLIANDGPLEEQLAPLPKYPLWRTSWRSPKDKTQSTLDAFSRGLADGDITTLDGVRAAYDDGWILVRPSGTEPKMRATVEAVDDAALERLKAKVLRIVQEIAPSIA